MPRTTCSTDNFKRTHGKGPRGFGRWAFMMTNRDQLPPALKHDGRFLDRCLPFFHTGKFGESKAAAVKHFAALRVPNVTVCP